MDKEQIARSQGIKISRLEREPEPRNRIEEALLPQLKKKEPVYEPVKPEEPKVRQHRMPWKKIVLGIIAVGILAAAVSGLLSIYKHYRASQADSSDMVLEEVGRLMDLPEGEEPTIATVNDLTPLQAEPFFREARVGDKVLIYSTAKKAVLYRPSTKKIIIVAPVR